MLTILLDALFAGAALLGLGVLAMYVKPYLAALRDLQAQLDEAAPTRSLRVRILTTSVLPAGAVIYRPQFQTKSGWLPLHTDLRAAA